MAQPPGSETVARPARGEQRPQHEDGGAHAAHQLVGRRGVWRCGGRGARRHAAGVAASSRIAVHADLHAVLREQMGQRGDIGEVRDVRKRQRLFGEQTRPPSAARPRFWRRKSRSPPSSGRPPLMRILSMNRPWRRGTAPRRHAAAREKSARPPRPLSRRTIGERRPRDKQKPPCLQAAKVLGLPCV